MQHRNQIIISLFIPLLALLCPHSAYAEGADWSATSQSVMSVYQFTTHIIAASLLCLGIWFLGGACLKLKYYRENPVQTPLSQPITLFVLAIIMLAFATFTMVSQHYVYATEGGTGPSSINQLFTEQLEQRASY